MIGTGRTVARLDYQREGMNPIRMWVHNDIEAAWRANACKKEPWTTAWIEAMPPGSVLYDLGANVGSYTLLAAALGYQVVAFEPAYPNFNALCENLALNNLLDKVLVFKVGIGAQSRPEWFQYRTLQPGAATHSLGQPPGGHPVMFHRQVIEIWALDAFLELYQAFVPRPTHIKLDLDGGELDALKGMPKVLDTLQSAMIEIKDEQAKEMAELLAEHGLAMVERFAMRNGQPLRGYAYGRFERSVT